MMDLSHMEQTVFSGVYSDCYFSSRKRKGVDFVVSQPFFPKAD